MKVRPVGLTPHVSRLPAHFRHDLVIQTGWLTFELTDAEALDLANRLVDATEKKETTNE